MSKNQAAKRFPLVAVAIILVGLLALGVFLFRSREGARELGLPSSARPNIVAKTTPSALPVEAKEEKETDLSQPVEAPVSAEASGVSAIITSPTLNNLAAVDQIIASLPWLSKLEQAEAAHHVANLSDDQAAQKWGTTLIADTLPASAAEVLFADLSNRPAQVSWPIWAAIADNPKNSRNQDSINILGVLLPPPAGNETWTKIVQTSLNQQK